MPAKGRAPRENTSHLAGNRPLGETATAMRAGYLSEIANPLKSALAINPT
jgi:hypothetical protein